VVCTEVTFADFGIIRASFTIMSLPSCFLKKMSSFGLGTFFCVVVFLSNPPGSDLFDKMQQKCTILQHGFCFYVSSGATALHMHSKLACKVHLCDLETQILCNARLHQQHP